MLCYRKSNSPYSLNTSNSRHNMTLNSGRIFKLLTTADITVHEFLVANSGGLSSQKIPICICT